MLVCYLSKLGIIRLLFLNVQSRFKRSYFFKLETRITNLYSISYLEIYNFIRTLRCCRALECYERLVQACYDKNRNKVFGTCTILQTHSHVDYRIFKYSRHSRKRITSRINETCNRPDVGLHCFVFYLWL